jgi:alpha-galactosidase
MVNFIRDVRKDLKSPELPFVIGVLGVGGKEEVIKGPDAKAVFKKAQAAAGDVEEFKGNVAVVHTDEFWDMEADAVFKKGWREHIDEWNTVGSDWPYHYLGSAKCYSRIGNAFAEAVIKLQKPQR